jgi:hypothetical protein
MRELRGSRYFLGRFFAGSALAPNTRFGAFFAFPFPAAVRPALAGTAPSCCALFRLVQKLQNTFQVSTRQGEQMSRRTRHKNFKATLDKSLHPCLSVGRQNHLRAALQKLIFGLEKHQPNTTQETHGG